MNKDEQLISVEKFKFSIFDSVPKPNGDTAYILYKEGGKPNQLLVITSQRPALSSQIRAGGFNRKATMSLALREVRIRREIADESNNHKFYVDVEISYRIKEIEYVFVNRVNIDEVVVDIINEIVGGFHKKYGILDQIELENEIRSCILTKVKALYYLEIVDSVIKVDVDDRAKKIIDSRLDTMAQSVVIQDKGEMASLEIEQKRRLEIQKQEAEKEIEEKKNAVNLTKVKGVNEIKAEVGDDYSLYLAYIKGEISSTEFDERLQHNKNADMMSKIAAFKQLVELDVLSGPAMEKAAMKLLGEDTGVVETEQKALTENTYTDSEIVVEDTEEY